MATVPLDPPILDPRNEQQLVEQALEGMFSSSNGALNDFSSGSPSRVLIEALCFCAAELLFYLNQVIDALVVAYLSNLGIQRRLGTYAQVTLTFTLTAPLSSPYTVPAGFTVADVTGRFLYTTLSAVTIPAGAISGDAIAQAIFPGSAYNLPAFRVINPTQPLAFVASVINNTPASGGSEEETQQEAIARGIALIRRRNLVSADDYEQEAIAFLGEGSVAKAIGNLSADKVSFQPGSVHVFVLDTTGREPGTATLSTLKATLSSRICLGTVVWVSPIDRRDIDVDLVAQLSPGEDPSAVADRLWAAMQAYLDPRQFPVGADLIQNELEFNLRLEGGVDFINSVVINGLGGNWACPTPYSIASPHSIFCLFTDGQGNEYQILRGAGEVYI